MGMANSIFRMSYRILAHKYGKLSLPFLDNPSLIPDYTPYKLVTDTKYNNIFIIYL
jgi:hypothetical protein